MVQTYFRTCWRTFLKYRFYSIVNVIGLSTGIAFALLIGSYVWSEYQVNAGLSNPDRLYILQSKDNKSNSEFNIITPTPLGRALTDQYPHLLAGVYTFDGVKVIVSNKEKHFTEEAQICDSSLFTMFGFTLKHGDSHTALNSPNSVVISSDLAKKLFGQTSVIGETLGVENFLGKEQRFIITGVLNKLPFNSVTHLFADESQLFLPMNSLDGRKLNFNDWSSSIVTYVKLRDDADLHKLNSAIQGVVSSHSQNQSIKNLDIKPFSLAKYYLGAKNGAGKKMIFIFSIIALFILLTAVINFVNISIATASSRGLEIGIRKVMGGSKKDLQIQFLTEFIFIASIAMILALGLYIGLRPLFEEVLGKKIPSIFSFPWYYIFVPVGGTLLIALFSGFYPSLVLAKFATIDSLKGKLKISQRNIWLRKALVTFQFAVAIFVFFSSFVISKQVNYFFDKDLGYNREKLLILGLPRDWSPKGLERMETVRNEFAELPEISEASLSYEIPNGNTGIGTSIQKTSDSSLIEPVSVKLLVTDEHYIETYKIRQSAGSFLKATDVFKVVINESAVKALGLMDAAEALGKQIQCKHFGEVYFTITGVIGDFNFDSMKEGVSPILFVHLRALNSYRYLTLKTRQDLSNTSLSVLQSKWVSFFPDAPFDYFNMDDTLARLYQPEIRLKKASYTAEVLALLIMFLGILGLVSLSLTRRTKEIAIRKILGASSWNIIFLFCKEFLFILVVANLIAFPIAGSLMRKWLDDFAYRIELSWSWFLLISIILAIFTILIIGLKTLKTGNLDPVKGLRIN
jgi:putative ABC transport system permease protein